MKFATKLLAEVIDGQTALFDNIGSFNVVGIAKETCLDAKFRGDSVDGGTEGCELRISHDKVASVDFAAFSDS